MSGLDTGIRSFLISGIRLDIRNVKSDLPAGRPDKRPKKPGISGASLKIKNSL